MQAFYDQLVNKSGLSESDQTWQDQLSIKTLDDLSLLKNSALEWTGWDEDEA